MNTLSAVLVAVALSGCMAKNLNAKTQHKIRLEANSKASESYCTLYDGLNQSGSSIRLTYPARTFSDHNFEDRTDSMCVTGIWLLYADENFNENNPSGSSFWLFGDNYCTNVPTTFVNKASSARPASDTYGWKEDTLTIFVENYFNGMGEEFNSDWSSIELNDKAKSVIITGCSPWTVYEYSNYQGMCKCLYPSSTTDCTPGFYSTESTLGYMAGTISSVKNGCYCSTKALPTNYLSGTQEGIF